MLPTAQNWNHCIAKPTDRISELAAVDRRAPEFALDELVFDKRPPCCALRHQEEQELERLWRQPRGFVTERDRSIGASEDQARPQVPRVQATEIQPKGDRVIRQQLQGRHGEDAGVLEREPDREIGVTVSRRAMTCGPAVRLISRPGGGRAETTCRMQGRCT